MEKLKSKYGAVRRSYKATKYVELMDFDCANPGCESGYDVEGHHILSMKRGGIDEYWNFIALCRRCHLVLAHRKKEWADTTLYAWKSFAELEKFGFVIDERDDDFRKHGGIKGARKAKEAEVFEGKGLDNVQAP